jgi:hypothetical protein
MDKVNIPEPDHTSSAEYKACYEERMHFWKICVKRAEQVESLQAELAEAKAKAEKLVEALKVYAADDYCGLKVGDPLDEQAAKLIYSAGHIAREALKDYQS